MENVITNSATSIITNNYKLVFDSFNIINQPIMSTLDISFS